LKDLWGFSKAVHEDDWNEGQNYTLKLKNSASVGSFATTLKLGRPTLTEDKDLPDAPPVTTVKVAAEEKAVLKFKEFGGSEVEAKYKNDGSLSYDIKSNALSLTEVDTLKDAVVTLEGKAKYSSTPLPTVGVKYSN